MNKIFLVAVLAIAFVTGCKTTGSNLADNLSYLETAKMNYDAGLKSLENAQYEEAVAFFEHVRSKYPYSQFAALADLAIADSYFAEKKWLLAADAYDFFMKYHPRHAKVSYALFQVAKSYYEARPSNFFLFPPSYVKDQNATDQALKTVNQFLDEFPSDANAKAANEMKQSLLLELAKHDLHVAKFYSARSHYKGALARYERVATLYPQSDVAAEALYASIQIAKHQLGEDLKAIGLAKRLVANYPKSSYAKDAQSYLTDSDVN